MAITGGGGREPGHLAISWGNSFDETGRYPGFISHIAGKSPINGDFDWNISDVQGHYPVYPCLMTPEATFLGTLKRSQDYQDLSIDQGW